VARRPTVRVAGAWGAGHIGPVLTSIRLRSALAALPDFGLAGLFLATWIAPRLLGAERIGHLLLVMLLEFIVVHSAAFMGTVAIEATTPLAKLKGTLGVGALYTLFVGGFALAFHTWWPLAAFWGLTLNRLLGMLVGQAPSGEAREFMRRGWAVGALAYLAAVFATSLLPIPALGVTAAVRDAANLPGSGLWIDQPWRVLAAGAFYFTILGLSELYDHAWMPGNVIAGRRTGGRADVKHEK
jgi:hypothetical protein